MFTNKLVAIINKELPSGVALNTLGHMALGLGASVDKASLRLSNYVDANGNNYPNISEMPFIVLRGTSNEIRKAVLAARAQNIHLGIFTNTMTGGGYQAQIDNTAQTTEDQLVYYGVLMFGPLEEVAVITKKFSLWRD